MTAAPSTPATADPNPVGGNSEQVRPDAAAPSGSSAARSNSTRLMCAGVHLDADFADQVVTELVGHRDRFVAPAYGYDSLCVLGHALAARRRHRIRRAALLLTPLTLLLVPLLSGLEALLSGVPVLSLMSVPILFIVSAWWAWCVLLVDRLVCMQVLMGQLRSSTFTGEVPGHRSLIRTYPKESEPEYIRIRREQAASADLVYYSGRSPFVGAGTLVRSWSFSVLLDRAAEPAMVRPDGPRESVPRLFTAAELLAHIERRLAGAIGAGAPAGQAVPGLQLHRRRYRTAITSNRPLPPSAVGEDASGRLPADGYDHARQYLCAQIGSWNQELVTSLFLGAHVEGTTLHTELHSYVLLPIRAIYHKVDRLPAHVGPRVVLRIAGETAAEVIGVLLHGVAAAVSRLANETGRSHREAPAESGADVLGGGTGDLTDWGARTSIRELAASESVHHFFQAVDQDKYAKVVERRVMEITADFLAEHGVDTSDFRRRQTTVLNYGVLQTGQGLIVNTGALATGVATEASSGRQS